MSVMYCLVLLVMIFCDLGSCYFVVYLYYFDGGDCGNYGVLYLFIDCLV